MTFVDQIESRVAEEALGHYCSTYVAPTGDFPPGLPEQMHIVVIDTGTLGASDLEPPPGRPRGADGAHRALRGAPGPAQRACPRPRGVPFALRRMDPGGRHRREAAGDALPGAAPGQATPGGPTPGHAAALPGRARRRAASPGPAHPVPPPHAAPQSPVPGRPCPRGTLRARGQGLRCHPAHPVGGDQAARGGVGPAAGPPRAALPGSHQRGTRGAGLGPADPGRHREPATGGERTARGAGGPAPHRGDPGHAADAVAAHRAVPVQRTRG